MKKIIALSFCIILCGCSMVSQFTSVHDFDSCVAAGNAILVSFSEQCSHEGITYVNTPQTIEMANPASTFCVEQGGTVEIRDEKGGQVGYCHLLDGTVIEEWEFFREKNKPSDDSHSGIPEDCKSWFDGCNNCIVGENGSLACTRKFCSPDMMQEPKCTQFENDFMGKEDLSEMKICTMEYAPVCGVDGKTYGNKCGAGDVEIDYEGECQ